MSTIKFKWMADLWAHLNSQMSKWHQFSPHNTQPTFFFYPQITKQAQEYRNKFSEVSMLQNFTLFEVTDTRGRLQTMLFFIIPEQVLIKHCIILIVSKIKKRLHNTLVCYLFQQIDISYLILIVVAVAHFLPLISVTLLRSALLIAVPETWRISPDFMNFIIIQTSV